MALTAILIILGAALALLTYIGGGFYTSLVWIWLPFVLTFAYFWALFLVHGAYMGVFSAIVKKSKREHYAPNAYAMWMISQTCYVLNFALRVNVHATGLGKLPEKDVPFMLVSNHLSGADHMYLLSMLPGRRIVCVSKKKNEKAPFAGGWIKYAGYLPIDQDDILSGTKVIEQAGEYIKEGICSVAIAPEGTRNKDFPHPELLPFHPGSFAMAYQSHCPIVVFGIQNTNCVFKRWPLRSTDVYLDCLAVIEYEDYKDMTPHDLANKTRDIIAARFERKRARFYHLPEKKPEEGEGK